MTKRNATTTSNLYELLPSFNKGSSTVRPSVNAGHYYTELTESDNGADKLKALTKAFERIADSDNVVSLPSLLNELAAMQLQLDDYQERLTRGKTGRKSSTALTDLIDDAVKAQMEINSASQHYEMRVINNGWLQKSLGITSDKANEFLSEHRLEIDAHNESLIMSLADSGNLGVSATQKYNAYKDGLMSKDAFLQSTLRGFNTQATKQSKLVDKPVRTVERDRNSEIPKLDADKLAGKA